ncbi:hypothetical protein GS399_20405 [Pedobacter sp. HMF7647]|uniref:Uncharacterized protein n=1 Tax=Hufsiella arboris TaxID=2695275 RepID=A0A7K1YGZ5_9SPHI|nr:hypothetical protein [Hufsiella arboris]MXV53329.1 hypothetical protein [Hufsiella arboris]
MKTIVEILKDIQRKNFETTFRNERLTNGAGEIYFKEGTVSILPLEMALVRLQDLHFKCTNSNGFIEISSQYSRKDFQSLYRVAATSLLCRILLTPIEYRKLIVDKILATAFSLGKSDGLESIFMTSVTSISDNDQANFSQQYFKKWKELGIPEVVGGNHGYSMILDSRFRLIPVNMENLIRVYNSERLNDIERFLTDRERLTVSESQCRGLLMLSGAVVFGYFGYRTGNTFGGISAGVAVGAAVAAVFCENDDEPSPNPAPSPSPDHDDDEPIPEETGCIANPNWGDFSFSDPYSNLSGLSEESIAVAFGQGLNAFIVRNNRNELSVTGFPTLERSTNGDVEIRDSGFLRGGDIEQQLRNQTRRGNLNHFKKESIRVKGKNNSFNPSFENINSNRDDSFITPERLRGYRVEFETKEYIITNENGEVEIVREELVTLHFQPGSKYAILFGNTSIDGDRAKQILESGILHFYFDHIQDNIDPGRDLS